MDDQCYLGNSSSSSSPWCCSRIWHESQPPILHPRLWSDELPLIGDRQLVVCYSETTLSQIVLHVCLNHHHHHHHHHHHQCRMAGGAVASLGQQGHGGWHASRVPLVNCSSPVESGLSIECGVYQGVLCRRDEEDDQQWQIDVPAEHHVRRNIISSRAKCPKAEMWRAARMSPNGVRLPARRHYWRSQTSESLADAEISCGRPLTLSCLLL